MCGYNINNVKLCIINYMFQLRIHHVSVCKILFQMYIKECLDLEKCWNQTMSGLGTLPESVLIETPSEECLWRTTLVNQPFPNAFNNITEMF